MKKLLSTLFITIIIASVTFAASSKEAADSYEDDPVTTKSQSNSNEDDKAPFFGGLSSNSEKYVTGNDLSVFTLNAINQIKQQDARVTYNMKTDKFGFGSAYLAAYYNVFMDKNNRDILEKAYNKYLDDFANKKLNRKDRKSNRAYGKMTVTLNWGTIRASTPNYGTAKAVLGYEFHDKSPYFTIQVPITFNEYSKDNAGALIESIPLFYCFTKAQMKALLDGISDEELNKIIPSKTYFNIQADDYFESEEVSDNVSETPEESTLSNE